MRNVEEDALLDEIKVEMGYEGEFLMERFLGEAERVEVCRDKLRVTRKQEDCG